MYFDIEFFNMVNIFDMDMWVNKADEHTVGLKCGTCNPGSANEVSLYYTEAPTKGKFRVIFKLYYDKRNNKRLISEYTENRLLALGFEYCTTRRHPDQLCWKNQSYILDNETGNIILEAVSEAFNNFNKYIGKEGRYCEF